MAVESEEGTKFDMKALVTKAEAKEAKRLQKEEKRAQEKLKRQKPWQNANEEPKPKAYSPCNKKGKRVLRLLRRANKLETQALKLQYEAAKLRAEHHILTVQEDNPTKDTEQSANSDGNKKEDEGKKSKSKKSKPTTRNGSDEANSELDSEEEASSEYSEEEDEEGTNKINKRKRASNNLLRSKLHVAEEIKQGKASGSKGKKNNKRKRDPETSGLEAELAELSAGDKTATAKEEPRKKKKKAKKSHKHAESPAATDANENGAADGAENWNVEALDGGGARQDKFLRLLGGKKAGMSVKANGKGKDSSDAKKVRSDEKNLEQQFEAATAIKESGKKRKGLGA